MDLPQGWQLVKLADHIEILSGFAFKSQLFSDYGDIPIIRIRDVKKGFSETYYLGKYKNQYIVNNGDLLIGMDGEFNLGIWKGGEALLNQRVCKVNVLNTINFNYLKFLLPIELKKIEEKTPFVTVKHLSVKNIQNVKIPLPPLEEQKRIAQILDKADEIRQKRKQAIQLTEQLLKSTFLDMFGDPVINPKGWEVKKLGDLITIKGGGTPDRKNSKYWNGNIFWASVKDVNSLELKTTQEFITEDGVNNSSTNIIPPETVLIVTRMAVGRICLTKNYIAINQDLKALFCNNNLLPKYLLFFLMMSQNSLLKYASGATVKGITVDVLNNLDIPLPSLDWQKKFIDIESKISFILDNNKKSLQESENLFNSLLQKAFKGEL
jgi:type I restriction enzyme S subunit